MRIAHTRMLRVLRVEGLSSVVSDGELKDRFQPFGKVTAVRRSPGKDGLRECAHLEVEMTGANLHKCISIYSKTRWKGCRLSVRVDKGRTPLDVHRKEDLPGNSNSQKNSVKTRKEPPQEKIKTNQSAKIKEDQVIKRAPEKNTETTEQRVKPADDTTGTSDRKPRVKVRYGQHGTPSQDTEGHGLSQATSREEKRQLSNQRRLKAIQQRQETTSNSKLSIDSRGESSASHRIVFSTSEESGGSDGEREVSGDDPLRRALFSSDDSGDSDGEQFAVRDQFEGKAGRKLFKLQQKIGIDKRFQLDERFLDESDGSDTSEETSQDQDELSEQLQKEKTKSLSILDSILGKETLSHRTSSKGVSGMFPQRYDPTSSDCVDLEQQSIELEQHSDSETSVRSEPVTMATEVPAVSQEKYYTVGNDLKGMFSGSSGHTFNFLDGETEEEESREAGVAEDLVRLKPRWMGSSDSRGVTTHDVGNSLVTVHKPKLLFFFHSANDKLVNRLDENTFYRSKPLEELEVGWGEKRVGMTHSYKKRHRDAVKLARKKRKH